MNDKLKVTVLDRSTWGTNFPYPMQREIIISKKCPCCGAERGEPKLTRQYDNGDYRYIHIWKNPCGHIDKYTEVLKEAMEIKKSERI